MKNKYIIIYCTIPLNENVKNNIINDLLQNKLIACANIIDNINSLYWWKNEIENDNEQLIIMKSKKELFEEICIHIKKNHPYEVPEIIATPIIMGNKDYLNWIEDNTK